MSRAQHRRIAGAVLAIALAATAASAYAGRPLDTEDATIVDEGWCQLESWVFASSSTRRYWLVPACNPFGNLELQVGFAREQPEDAPGHNDYVLHAKTLLKPLEANGWGIGLAGSAARFGGGEERTWGYTALLIVSRSLADDRVRLNGNAGALYTQRTSRLSGLWGFSGELDVTERVTVLGEVLGVSGEGRLAQVDGRVWLVPERVSLDGTVGRSDFSGSTETVFTFGIYLATPVR
jgi:hypothetical protein